jgi:hypothetical protein
MSLATITSVAHGMTRWLPISAVLSSLLLSIRQGDSLPDDRLGNPVPVPPLFIASDNKRRFSSGDDQVS